MKMFLCAVCTLLSFSATLSANQFEPLFRILAIEGEILVQTPGTDTFTPARENRAYHYGTTVKSGLNSSARIIFSEGNECLLDADVMVIVMENANNPTQKRLRLLNGRITLNLREEFQDLNSLLVETPSAVLIARGGRFSVTMRTEGDMQIAAIAVQRGGLSIEGPHYNIAELKRDDTLTVANSRDKTFTRIRVVRGAFSMEYRDQDGIPQFAELTTGSTVKIWRRRSVTGQTVVVTILITTAGGDIERTITYAEAIERPDDAELPEFERPADYFEVRRKLEQEADERPKTWWQRLRERTSDRPERPDIDDLDEWDDFPELTTPVPTTTTTIPSVTPVGRL